MCARRRPWARPPLLRFQQNKETRQACPYKHSTDTENLNATSPFWSATGRCDDRRYRGNRPAVLRQEHHRESGGMRPYSPLELAGRDIYVREGCYLCHSQMIRPFRDEVERYGHYSLAAENHVRSSLPMGVKAHGTRPCTRRRPVLGRLACRPSDEPALRGAGNRSCRATVSWRRLSLMVHHVGTPEGEPIAWCAIF